jgi:hypothetical protein
LKIIDLLNEEIVHLYTIASKTAILYFCLRACTCGFNRERPYAVVNHEDLHGQGFDLTPLVLQSSDPVVSEEALDALVAEVLNMQLMDIDTREILFKERNITIIIPSIQMKPRAI